MDAKIVARLLEGLQKTEFRVTYRPSVGSDSAIATTDNRNVIRYTGGNQITFEFGAARTGDAAADVTAGRAESIAAFLPRLPWNGAAAHARKVLFAVEAAA